VYWILGFVGIDLERQIWLLQRQLFGPAKVGIWQDNPIFGWTNKPNAVGRHRKPPDFDVQYHTDKYKHRITVTSYQLPKLLFLGGSFTFGHGVEDDEPYPAVLQKRWPQYKIINGAVNAWGTTQALLKLKEQLKRHDDIRLVVYGFITHHLYRNFLRKSWLKQIAVNRNRRNPYFNLVNGQLVFQGLADYKRDGMLDGIEVAAMEITMTLKMLEKMKNLCQRSAISLLLLYLPDGSSNKLPQHFMKIFEPDFYLDLRQVVNYSKNKFVYDYHPTAKGHRLIADGIQPVLEKICSNFDK
jgi:lysophospholipase L1-like esterase